MLPLSSSRFVAVWVAVAALGVAACGPTKKNDLAKSPPKMVEKDKFKNATRCDTQKPGVEVSYHDLAGTGKADMVKLVSYTKQGGGVSSGHIICIELDTNHDGVLDLVRVFDDKGGLESEEADRNYDGKSDIWIHYKDGVLSKQVFDTQFNGKPNEFHYYKDGKLKRVERDRNGDGNVDVWEYYVNDRLERMGVDTDFNGKIDIWYRDEVARAESKKLGGGGGAGPAASGAASGTASGAPAGSGSAAPSGSVKKKSKEAE